MKRIIISLILIFPLIISAQSVINSSGGSNNLMSYSIGEIVVSTISSPQNILTQGVLQPVGDNITKIDLVNIDDSFLLFPNPVINCFEIVSNQKIKLVEIYTIEGKKVFKQTYESKPISITHLKYGSYIVKAHYANNKETKIVKIIKID